MPIGSTSVQGAKVHNVEELLRKLGELGLEVFPAANARAVNRVASTLKARSARAIAEQTGLKVGSVRRRVVIRRRASRADPRAVLEITGKPLNLREFVSGGAKEPRSPRGGVTARAWGRRRKYSGVFLARMRNGEVIAVKRSAAGKRGKKIRTGRWAYISPHIQAVWGPGIAKEATGPILVRQRAEVFRERYPIELQHELAFRIAKLLKKRGL